MSLKGEYVTDEHEQIGMIESDAADAEGCVMVYYGTSDTNVHRHLRQLNTLKAIQTPINGRINGIIPEEFNERTSSEDPA